MKKQQLIYIIVWSIFTFGCISGTNVKYSKTFEDESKEVYDSSDNNSSIKFRSAGQIRFEDQHSSELTNYPEHNHRPVRTGIKFEDDSSVQESINTGRITFEEDNVNQLNRPVGLNFQDDNKIEDSGIKKKRRRRRRKPRFQKLQGSFAGPQYPIRQIPIGGLPYPGQAGAVQPYPGFGPVEQNYRPPRRQKPSFASEALSSVTTALTSIALYDDYQCVPRLLCEAAGGGALSSSGVLKSVAGLQPLLTILSAYNGISSSPLFVFGRAVFLGMTAGGNTASCRYAYPQCPTDPKQLVHYLNNHNGGFFRFFNSPQQNPQNLEQFYQQLSLQGQYGLQNPPPPFGTHFQNLQILQGQQNYGLYDPLSNQQCYGFHQPPNGNISPHYGYYRPQTDQYPQYNHQYNGINTQYQNSLYPKPSNGFDYQHNYGKKYPYNKKYGLNKERTKESDIQENGIQRRIQNKPNNENTFSNIEHIAFDSKLKFPGETKQETDDDNNNRDSKSLKFPEDDNNLEVHVTNNRIAKNIHFPESAYHNSNAGGSIYKLTNQYSNYPMFNVKDSALDHYLKYYSYYHGNSADDDKYYNNMNKDEEGVQTVYVVRGNGDPNHPEIVKIHPGEEINL